MNLREALQIALHLGCTVREKPSTGETVIKHPRWRDGVTVNRRRKSAVVALTSRLEKLSRDQQRASIKGDKCFSGA